MTDGHTTQPPQPRAERARLNGDHYSETVLLGTQGLSEAMDDKDITTTLMDNIELLKLSALLAIEARLDEIAALMRDR